MFCTSMARFSTVSIRDMLSVLSSMNARPRDIDACGSTSFFFDELDSIIFRYIICVYVTLISQVLIFHYSNTKTHRKLDRRPLLFLPQSYWDAQLFVAVVHELVILKVSGQADVSKDRFFELDAGLHKLAVDVHRGNLLGISHAEWFEPIDKVVVFLHFLDEITQMDWLVRDTRTSALHDPVRIYVETFHAPRGIWSHMCVIYYK